MITLLKSKINSLDKFHLENLQIYADRQEYVQSCMPTQIEGEVKCPCCGAKNRFHYHATYDRYIDFVLNGLLVNFKVSVTRVMCDSCNSTHALFPNFIIPYKITSLDAMVTIVTNSITTSVLKVSDTLNISYQLIYMYINLILSFFLDVNVINNINHYSTNFNEVYFLSHIIDFADNNFLIEYYTLNKWIFLMTKFRNISPPVIYVKVSKVPST